MKLTPKEKADELLKMFVEVIPINGDIKHTVKEASDIIIEHHLMCKKCALITAEENKNSIIWHSDFSGERRKYFEAVIEELNLL